MVRTADPLLTDLGRTIQGLRKRAGLTLRGLAARAGVSERFLGEVERGGANPSVLRLADVARALGVPLGDLLGAPPLAPPHRAGAPSVALMGLRGAGKSSVGRRLAEALARPFVELDEEVEKAAGLTLSEIFELHGQDYYRRAEREVLRRVLADGEPKVIATGGGIVHEPDTFAALKQGTRTVWLKARPEDHWERVIAQGDTRPMEGNERAFSHLCAILSERETLYRQAELVIDTSGRDVEQICAAVQEGLVLPRR